MKRLFLIISVETQYASLTYPFIPNETISYYHYTN